MNTNVIILAAGKGTRMKTSLPKVLQTIGNESLINRAIKIAKDFNPKRIVLILGHEQELIKEHLKNFSELEFATQIPQQGTGHAIQECFKQKKDLFDTGSIIILSGDVPFLSKDGIEFLKKEENSFLSMKVDRPNTYGRVLGCANEKLGEVFTASKIKEFKDCSDQEKKIVIVNSGVYRFDAKLLRDNILNLKSNNAQNEFYLTDLINNTKSIVLDEIMGVNDLEDLMHLEKGFYKKRNSELMKSGVRILDPDTTRIDELVSIEADVIIHPGTTIKANKKVLIQSGTEILQGNFIENCNIGKNCFLYPNNVLEDSSIENNVKIGPFAHLRPGSVLKSKVKIGNFVEVKKSVIGEESKVSHLSYVGDAEIGRDVNVGCGFITCNYDGYNKHKTTIEDGVFVGSDVQAVAPITIGKNSNIAAGTTLTKDVPEDALAIARTPQETKLGYAPRMRARLNKKKD